MPKQKSKTGKASITYTAVIWTGLLLAVFGALVAALNLGGITTFTFKWKDVVELNSTSIGLIIMGAGILLVVYVIGKLPKGPGVLMKTFTGKLTG